MNITDLPENEIPDVVPQDADISSFDDVSIVDLLKEADNTSEYDSEIEGMN